MRLIKRGILALGLFIALLNTAYAQAGTADWEAGRSIPEGGITNPYSLPVARFEEALTKGRKHAAYYPVENTGLIFPYYPVKRVLEASTDNPLKRFLLNLFGRFAPFENFEDLQAWLGLSPYPSSGNAPFPLPEKDLHRPEHRLGTTFLDTPNGLGFTVSCAKCHSSELFGKTVLGMSQRFPRANEMFSYALKAAPLVSTSMYRWSAEANEGEVKMYLELKDRLRHVGAKKPTQLGLDTSLAQVALSLAKRDQDPWATKSKPKRRRDLLQHHIADSKPAVWWNVKYKNRWLSDGSIVSGNPIITNLLWNEIGRSADLQDFANWVEENPRVIEELTTAVFSNKAPHWTDFFATQSIDELKARRGEAHFNKACAKCHGTYIKNWDRPDAAFLSPAERLNNWRVLYKEKTPVVDVGTDPGRYQGMKSLEALNNLAITDRYGIRVETQKGYVPPPLVGIWARWPYFHNNSAPTLCAVLSRSQDRPRSYWARPAEDPQKDFDSQCNGYPQGRPRKASKEWHYNTRREGLSNRGHDEGIFLSKGQEIFSPEQKMELIQYLQTL